MFKDIHDKNNVYKNLVDGKWIESDKNELIEIKSPIDGTLVGKIQAMTSEDVDFVVKSSKEAQLEWRKVPANEKSAILNKAADILLENVEIISNMLVREVAKDKKGAVAEVTRTADYIRYTADSIKHMTGESIPGDSFPGFNKKKISLVTREPLGVVLAISPFNYPINLSASKIAPAIAAGNSVILKPATQGSISALYLVRVFEEAGVPAGVINTITGRGSEIGDYVVSKKEIDFINFTGSTKIGKKISKLVQMKPLLMELGGKDAAIVLEDADLELTASNIVAGAYSYSGQRCTALKRILVMDSVADKLIKIVLEKMKDIKVGNPLEIEDVTIVPLIDTKSADFVMELIEDAKTKGAKLLTGGTRDGNLISATLFDNVTKEMRLAWEEPFGPVLPIMRMHSVDEAIDIANKSEYGLQSSVFTKDINKAFYIAERLEVGTVQINNKTERGPDHFPFLGVKSSGIGTQGIKYSIESMSRPKAIVLNIETDVF